MQLRKSAVAVAGISLVMSSLGVAAFAPAAQAASCTGRVYYDRPYDGTNHPGVAGLAKVVNTCEKTVVKVKVDVSGGFDTSCKTIGGGGTASFDYVAYQKVGVAHAQGVKNC